MCTAAAGQRPRGGGGGEEEGSERAPYVALFFWLMDWGYLFLQRVSLFLGLLQLRLKLSDLGNVAGGLKEDGGQRFDFPIFFPPKSKRGGLGRRPYLSNEGFVLLHQFVQVLLVLLQPLEQVRLLVLQQAQLLVRLQDDTGVDGWSRPGISGLPRVIVINPSRSPGPSAGRCSPARSACSPAPGTESSGRPRPPDVWLRFPPANWRRGESG